MIFKFKDFQEIEKAHKRHVQLKAKAYKSDVSYLNNGKKADNDFSLWEKYDLDVYAKIIFDSLSVIKPEIHQLSNKQTYTWTELFFGTFDELSVNNKRILVGMIEQDGNFRLPPQFYGKQNNSTFAKRHREHAEKENTIKLHKKLIMKYLKEQGLKPTEKNINELYKKIKDTI